MNFERILSNYFLKEPKIINKIAFYITEEYLFDHYINIIQKLKTNSFEIIFSNKFRQNKYIKLIDKIKSYGWNIVFLNDVLYKYKYKILITHLYLGGDTIINETYRTRISVLSLSII